MHHLQRMRHTVHDAHEPALVNARGDGVERLAQRLATVERHHHVGGAALLPKAVDLEQRRVVELRQQTRLVDEAAHAQIEGFAVALGQRHHGAVVQSRRERNRQVLLDGHHAFQRVVPGFVDRAKAALADQVGDLKLGQPTASRQHTSLVNVWPAARGGKRHRRGTRTGDDGGLVVDGGWPRAQPTGWRWRAGSGGRHRIAVFCRGLAVGQHACDVVVHVAPRWSTHAPSRNPNKASKRSPSGSPAQRICQP